MSKNVNARYYFRCVLVVIISLFILLLHPTEKVIRFSGLILQLMGIGTIIWGISETRALFGYPSFAKTIRTLFSRLLSRRKPVVGVGSVKLPVISSKGRAHQIYGPDNSTNEARLEALEKNVRSIHDRISGTQKEIDEEFQKVTNSLKREEEARQADYKAVQEKLEATATGGVHISATGAIWLFFGVILSTAAAEIAELLR